MNIISKYKKVFNYDELEKSSVIRKFQITALDGKTINTREREYMNNKKYQVLISSTYADLKEENELIKQKHLSKLY